MALVDFTNPDAARWFTGKLKAPARQGVDCFKTDFGERIPTDVVWHDGSDPRADAQLLHAALQPGRLRRCCEAERGRGRGGAVRPLGHRRRPAVPGALGRRLRVDVRRRWPRRCAAGCRWRRPASASGATTSAASRARPTRRCSSAGSRSGCCPRTAGCTARSSYRVPWAFDEEAVDVLRHFTQLKLPADAVPVRRRRSRRTATGIADDAADGRWSSRTTRPRRTWTGSTCSAPDVLVAPVFSADGEVAFYVPAGTWTHLVTGAQVTGPAGSTEKHGFDSLPVLARPGAVIPFGAAHRPAGLRRGPTVCALRLYAPARGAADPRVRGHRRPADGAGRRSSTVRYRGRDGRRAELVAGDRRRATICEMPTRRAER